MASRAPTRDAHAEVVAGIRELVKNNLADPHEVGNLATELGYSERQLRRILREGGIHWRPWLAEQRMRRAAELLLNGRRVGPVAAKVCYRADGLAAPFLAYTGVRPTDARRARAAACPAHVAAAQSAAVRGSLCPLPRG